MIRDEISSRILSCYGFIDLSSDGDCRKQVIRKYGKLVPAILHGFLRRDPWTRSEMKFLA